MNSRERVLARQNILPKGSPQDVFRAAEIMKKLLYKNGGGLIGQCEIGKDVPINNVRALLECWR